MVQIGLTDGERVSAARSGDASAFESLYRDWYPPVHDLCLRILDDADAAADAAQDCFLTSFRRLPDLRDPDRFGAWVLRIARNTALRRRWRDRRVRQKDIEELLAAEASAAQSGRPFETVGHQERSGPYPDPPRAAELAELHRLVWTAVRALRPRDATVLSLQLRHGLANGELASALGVSPAHANVIAHRARRRFGAALQAHVLWRGGAPECEALDRTLQRLGRPSFGPELSRLLERHARRCRECRREAARSPAELLAGLPLARTHLFGGRRVSLHSLLVRLSEWSAAASRAAESVGTLAARRVGAVAAVLVMALGSLSGPASPHSPHRPTSRATASAPTFQAPIQSPSPTLPAGPGAAPAPERAKTAPVSTGTGSMTTGSSAGTASEATGTTARPPSRRIKRFPSAQIVTAAGIQPASPGNTVAPAGSSGPSRLLVADSAETAATDPLPGSLADAWALRSTGD